MLSFYDRKKHFQFLGTFFFGKQQTPSKRKCFC
jgi:hypothetical protein